MPLAIATGPSAASQNTIATGLLGDMISATVLAIFVPAFFVFVLKLMPTKRPVLDGETPQQETRQPTPDPVPGALPPGLRKSPGVLFFGG